MKCKAVIFDLFGTLVRNFSSQGYNDALRQMAVALSLSPEDFRQAWFATSNYRNIGASQNCTSDVEYICRELGVIPQARDIELAVEVRLNYIRQVMTPQPHAVETLSVLKAEGYKTGLLSNCSHEIPVVWPESPLAPLIDVTVFSCSVNIRKPDPRIFRLTAERLGIPLDECLYIGDGGSQELSAALTIGMHPVLIRPDAESAEHHLMNREEWDGPEISTLEDVLIVLRDGLDSIIP